MGIELGLILYGRNTTEGVQEENFEQLNLNLKKMCNTVP